MSTQPSQKSIKSDGFTADSLWTGVFSSFEEAGGSVEAFDSDLWQQRLNQKISSDISNHGNKGSISPLAVTREYQLPLLVALRCAELGAPLTDKPVRIVDFGGGHGGTFLRVRGCLPEAFQLDYRVVERAAVCDFVRPEMERFSELQFYETFDQTCANNWYPDIIHVGSTLHYIEDWVAQLSAFASKRPKYLFLSDLLAGDIPNFVTTQIYYEHRIPVHFWNFDSFVSVLENLAYELVFHTHYEAAFLGTPQPQPMNRLPETHRLRHACHLLFRLRNDV